MPISAVSRFWQNPAFPKGSGPDFINAAIAASWSGTAEALLTGLHRIEADLGRQRRERWGARVIDLDLIALGDQVLPDSETYHHWCHLPLEAQRQSAPNQVILPHPRLQDRAFVLVPLVEIAPEWRHPVLGQTIRQLHDACPAEARAEMVPLA